MKRMTSIAAVLTAAAMLALAAGCGEAQKPAQADSPAQTAQTKETEKPAQVKPKEMQVHVYYPRNDGTGLVAVSRTVNIEKDDKYAAALKSLLTGTKEKGQTNVIPKKAQLRSVMVKDGVATADFSRELEQNFSGGSTGE